MPSSVPLGRVEPGVQLGSYEVLTCIARGGMATVWAARQHGARGFSRLVALKTVLAELSVPEFEEMFVEEARIASRIHHPNVCEVFELVEHSGVLALSMEWVDGETLAALLGNNYQRPINHRVAAYIIAEVARGLHAAHELCDESGMPMQLVHRDVSPQNVLLSRNGHVKVADFGVAKALGSCREPTACGQVKGKVNYMSPEQARGQPLDRRSDIFSLGVVLYTSVLGRHPFQRSGESRRHQFLRLLSGDVALDSSVHCPPGLAKILRRALASDPNGRYATAAEMREDLLAYVAQSRTQVTEAHVAELIMARVGDRVQKRQERIRQCLEQSKRDPDDYSDRSEATFVPTTHETSTLKRPSQIRVPRRSRLPVLAALAAIACGIGLRVLTAPGEGDSSQASPATTLARNNAHVHTAGAESSTSLAVQPSKAPRGAKSATDHRVVAEQTPKNSLKGARRETEREAPMATPAPQTQTAELAAAATTAANTTQGPAANPASKTAPPATSTTTQEHSKTKPAKPRRSLRNKRRMVRKRKAAKKTSAKRKRQQSTQPKRASRKAVSAARPLPKIGPLELDL